MKRSKRIYLLLGVLAAASLATLGVIQVEEYKEQIQSSDEIVLELSPDSVQSLSWEYESEALSFHKEEEGWVYDEDTAFPVDEEKINELLSRFEAFGVTFIIEEVEDYGQYGLEDPVCTISLATQDQSYEILLGDYSTMDSNRYVSIGDGNVYLAAEDPLDDFDAVLSDMIDHDEIPSFDQVTEISFSGTEAYSILYQENSTDTYCADDMYFAQIEGSSLPLDTSRVNGYLNDITGLELTDYVTYNATQEELNSYGLNTPELTVTIDYTWTDQEETESSDTFVLHVSRDPQEIQAAQEDSAENASSEDTDQESDISSQEEITAYARVGESQIVYRLSSSDYENLMAASYDSLRHLEVLSADFADILQIDISLEGNDYTITCQETDEERTYYYQEEAVEIADFQSALESLSADSFTQEQPEGKEEIGLTVYLDNENYPEVQIALYRYDGDYCLAMVDNEPVSLVERSYVVDLMEAVYAIVLN